MPLYYFDERDKIGRKIDSLGAELHDFKAAVARAMELLTEIAHLGIGTGAASFFAIDLRLDPDGKVVASFGLSSTMLGDASTPADMLHLRRK